MTNRVLLGLGLVSLLLPAMAIGAPPAQGQAPPLLRPPLVSAEPPKWEDRRMGMAFEASRLRQVVDDLPASASADEVELALYEVLPQVYRATIPYVILLALAILLITYVPWMTLAPLELAGWRPD